MGRIEPSFLNGIPELAVLQLLSKREMYGYELVSAIQEQSRDTFSFAEGVIYPYLHYLEDEKFVASRKTTAQGRSRVYYRLTARGTKRLDELVTEWKRVALGVRLILGETRA